MAQHLAQQSDLTEMQVALLEGILQGKDIEQAKRDAGYAETTMVARMLRTSPAMAEALDYEIRKRLRFEGAPLAYNLLVQVVRDEKYNERVRVDAARTLLDRAGYLPPARPAPDGADRNPSDMTVEELHAEIARLDRQIVERAKHVGSTSATGEAPPAGDLYELD